MNFCAKSWPCSQNRSKEFLTEFHHFFWPSWHWTEIKTNRQVSKIDKFRSHPKIYLTLSETDFCVRLVWLADWSQNEVLRIFAPTYVKLILRILRTSVLSNTENIENFSFDFKLGSQKCSQLTFLMNSGYLITAKCLPN